MTDDPLSVCCRHLANSQHIIEAKDAEIARLRLTDAEREALWVAIAYAQNGGNATVESALRGLITRMGVSDAIP